MKGKIIFITGATSGIGEGCARKFAAMGSDLILNGRNTEKLEKLRKELTATGVKVLTLPFDVRNRQAASRAIGSLEGKWCEIDVLVNNAGLVIGMDKEHEGSLDEWDVVIDTNIKGLLAMTRMIVPGMVERGRGHIINIGSIAGDAAYAGGSVYCATKAAVKALSDGLRIDLVDTPWSIMPPRRLPISRSRRSWSCRPIRRLAPFATGQNKRHHLISGPISSQSPK